MSNPFNGMTVGADFDSNTGETTPSPALQDASNLSAEIARLQAENAELKTAAVARTKDKALTCKVSPKGAVSVYGMGRFPVTLYRSQMERLLGHSEAIKAFMVANASNLKVKG